jgi:hypothetical protein
VRRRISVEEAAPLDMDGLTEVEDMGGREEGLRSDISKQISSGDECFRFFKSRANVRFGRHPGSEGELPPGAEIGGAHKMLERTPSLLQ